MKAGVPSIAVFLAAALVLGGCGTGDTASPSHETSASIEPTSQPTDLVADPCELAPEPFDPNNIDLTGAWAGDDGGIYYFRQIGSVLWWNGMSGRDLGPLELGRAWNNVGRGVIDGLEIVVEWSDVPRGEIFGDGTLI